MEQVEPAKRCIVRFTQYGSIEELEVSGHEWHGDIIGCIHCGLLIRGRGLEFVRPTGQRQPDSA